MIRRVIRHLFPRTARPRYRATHRNHWGHDPAPAPALTRPYRYEHTPADVWLPPHVTITVSPSDYADECPTQTLPLIPDTPPPFIRGRSLTTGRPALFGNAASALLSGLGVAVPITVALYFADA